MYRWDFARTVAAARARPGAAPDDDALPARGSFAARAVRAFLVGRGALTRTAAVGLHQALPAHAARVLSASAKGARLGALIPEDEAEQMGLAAVVEDARFEWEPAPVAGGENVSAAEERAIALRAGQTEERPVRGYGPAAADGGLVAPAADSMARNPAFERAATSFEARLGALAWDHPNATGAAERMSAAAKRYILVRVAEPWDAAGARLCQALATIGSDDVSWSGSVGKEARAVMAVFDEGNVAERLCHVENFFTEYLARDLASNMAGEEFLQIVVVAELHAAELLRRREGIKAAGGSKYALFGDFSTVVEKQWHTRVPRYDHDEAPQRNRSERRIGETGATLSPREVALHGRDDPDWNPERDAVKWHEGMRRWIVNERDRWASLHRRMSVPIGAGPSGTTSRLLQAARCLSISDMGALYDVRLACIAYLVPARHHTLVEVLEGAAGEGLPYTAGQRMYRDVKPLTDEELRSCGEAGRYPDEAAGDVALGGEDER